MTLSLNELRHKETLHSFSYLFDNSWFHGIKGDNHSDNGPIGTQEHRQHRFCIGGYQVVTYLIGKRKKKKTEPKEEIKTNRLAINELNFSSVQ